MALLASRAEDRSFGGATVLTGQRGGKYPHGNSLLVQGSNETIVVDPSLSLRGRVGGEGSVGGGIRVDRVVNSHCHEDHVAGNHLFPDVPWSLHRLDEPGIRSLDGLMAIYGMTPVIESAFRQVVVDDFHFAARSDAQTFVDGEIWDLGGCRVRVIHTPGHTRGHSCFHVEPDDLIYLGDIDLTSFGPYYGDAWSCLEDFERSLAKVRAIDARWYATFHHVGVVEGRAAFLEKLDRFAAVIASRERRLLEFLAEPRSLAEIVTHRFVYRPGDAVAFADDVERRSMAQHLDRLTASGRVEAVEPGRFRAC